MRFRFPPHPNRLARWGTIALGLLAIVVLPAQAASAKARTAAEWASYGGDKGSTKYAPLTQINRENFKRLKVAWTWRSADEEVIKANPGLKTWVWESTPLMVGGVLFVSTSLSQVAALDAATGKTRWVCQLPLPLKGRGLSLTEGRTFSRRPRPRQ